MAAISTAPVASIAFMRSTADPADPEESQPRGAVAHGIDQRLEEAVGPVAGGVERLAQPRPADSGGCRAAWDRARPDATASTASRTPCGIDRRIALVGVDHVEPAPVPQLHVHLARTVLVIAGDDQPAALGGEFGGEVERPLLAHRLDHPLAEAPPVRALHLLDDRASGRP